MKARDVSVVVVAALVGGACADARITGTLGDRTVRATGTVAAWIDSTVFEDQGDGTSTREERKTDATVLHIALFEHVFDPSVDFGALPAGERAALVDDINRGDRILVDVRRGEALRDGDEIATLPREGLPPQVLPFVDDVDLFLVDRPGDGAPYPDEVARPGSEIDAVFDVDTTSPTLAGVIELDVKADDDEDNALEGELRIELSTTLLPERTAECNFDRFGQGSVDACTLLPLSNAAAPGGGLGSVDGGFVGGE